MSDVERELSCAEEGVLLVRRPWSTLRVTGKDRLSWLNGLVTQDLAPRKPGDAVLGIVVAKTGKIEAEVAVVIGDDELAVGLPADRAERVREKLDRHLIMEDAAIEPDASAWVLAFGRGAAKALDVARAAGARGGVTQRGGMPVAVIVSSGVESVVEAVIASVPRSAVATEAGWNRFRVEHGIAERGHDYTDDESYPQEAALEKDEVSFAKGCYLGQEAVFMLEKRGHVSKRLVQLVASAELPVGASIEDGEGKVIGSITSSASRAEGHVALAIVKYKHARRDHPLHVKAGDASIEARVTALLAIADPA
jgi:folate-binding protein YgfZ